MANNLPGCLEHSFQTYKTPPKTTIKMLCKFGSSKVNEEMQGLK